MNISESWILKMRSRLKTHDNICRLSNLPMDCSAKMTCSSFDILQLTQLKRCLPNVPALLYSDSVGLPTCSTMHGVYRVARNVLPWSGTRRSLPPKRGLGNHVKSHAWNWKSSIKHHSKIIIKQHQTY